MSKYLKLILRIVGVLILLGVVVFIGIQFVPVKRTNPPVVSEPKWDSSQTRTLAERACFDCHSNETKWPWYAKVAPVSWVMADDVEEGRAKLNFSEWGVNKGEGGKEAGEGREEGETDEIATVVEKGRMPLPIYLFLHPEARLTATEIQTLIAGLKATFGSGAEGAMVK